MPWFKVDDGLFLHQKIVKAGNAAMGLWLRAGSWSAHHLTEGFIPDSVIEVLGTATQRDKLIKVGLWFAAEGGVQFHEWNERQPTRDEVAEQRSAWAARKRKSRLSASEKNFSEDFRDENISENPTSSQVSAMRHADVTPSYSRPVPTEGLQTPSESVVPRAGRAVAVQPPLLDVVTDPSPPAPTTTASAVASTVATATTATTAATTARGTRLSEDWLPTQATLDWSQQWGRDHPGLNVRNEWAKFQNYWLSTPGAKGRKVNWDRTWRNWLMTATERLPRWKQEADAPAPLTNAQKRRRDSRARVAAIAAREAAERSALIDRRALQA